MIRDDGENPLSPEERDALHAVGEEIRLPADLREATTRAVHRAGLIGTPARRRFTWSPGWAAAAAALAFVAGLALGPRWLPRERSSEPPIAQGAPAGRYLLLLFEDDRYDSPTSDAAMTERIGEYTAWAARLRRERRLGDAAKLTPGGRWLTPGDSGVASGPPVPDPRRGTIAGFFEILAHDESEATRISNDCPHLRYGGTIELRRIDDGRD